MKDNREIKKASSIWRSRGVCVIATTLILWVWGDIAQPQATSCQVGTYDCAGQLYLSNGNVGIGTTTPGQKLDVAGNLAISGTMTNGTVLLDRIVEVKNGQPITFDSVGVGDVIDIAAHIMFNTSSSTGTVLVAISVSGTAQTESRGGLASFFNTGPIFNAAVSIHPKITVISPGTLTVTITAFGGNFSGITARSLTGFRFKKA